MGIVLITYNLWSTNCAPSSSHVQLFATPWTVACQALLSMGFSRQEYWRGLPFPSPGDLLKPGIEPTSPVSPALAGGFFTTEPRGKSYLDTHKDLIRKYKWLAIDNAILVWLNLSPLHGEVKYFWSLHISSFWRHSWTSVKSLLCPWQEWILLWHQPAYRNINKRAPFLWSLWLVQPWAHDPS